jgi:hypothetical protein
MKRLFLLNALLSLGIWVLFLQCDRPSEEPQKRPTTYDELVTFFKEWRSFNNPEMKDGVPNYQVAAMKRQHGELQNWQKKLKSFDTTRWPIKHQVDWYLIWAEMNGLDFDHRVIRPWERDPAFYVWFYPYESDVPEREGPNIFGAIELPTYTQPLSENDAAEIAGRLRKISALYEQARLNLKGKAKDLWMTGIRSIRDQSNELSAFAERERAAHPELAAAALEAKAVSDEFALWLDEQAPEKKALSGVGKEDYTWYLRNVHLLPSSWEQEEALLERELYRAHSALRLLENANRNLPPLEKASNATDYQNMLTQGVEEYMAFLERENFLTVKPYMKPAMLAQIRPFVENPGIRGFFDEVDYRDPMPMRAHHYHWIEKARERLEPNESPIRQVPLLYNIFDSRAEGMATAMEELVMNAGLMDNRPRGKELVYIMLIQRAARGLAGLKQHGLELTFDEATQFASKWVPRGYLPADGGTIQSEEQFYLEQPGYGSSYVVGKIDIDRMIAEYARQRGESFQLKSFMDEFNAVGIIPTSLVYWQMTGDKSMVLEATTPSKK